MGLGHPGRPNRLRSEEPRQTGSTITATPLHIDLVRTLWSIPVSEEAFSGNGGENSDHAAALFRKSFLFLQDARGVRAFHLENGQPAWASTSKDDAGFLWDSSGGSQRISRLQRQLRFDPLLRDSLWIGQVDDLLVALDTSAEGRLLWGLRIEHLLGDLAAEGEVACAPIADKDGILIAVHQHSPRSRTLVACTMDGKVQWRSRNVPCPLDVESIPDGIAVTDARAYWNAGGHRVLAADRQTGRIIWQTELARSPASSKIPSPQNGLPRGKTLFLHGDLLCVLSAGQVSLLNATTGQLRWTSDLAAPINQLLGIDGNLLIGVGHHLSAIDLVVPSLRWSIRSEEKSSAPGCCLLQGGTLLYSTNGELRTLETQTGRIVQRDLLPLGAGEHVCGLSLEQNTLLIVTDQYCRAVRILRRDLSH